ncbi:MAG: phosphoglycerate kinase [SAR202 cluster bacterium]|nr:phosphoglycerate kinase [SAR202 cluster bacterium]
MPKKSVKNIEVTGKTVLLRVDFNVPFKPNTTEIADDSRIRASLPTIQYLLAMNCRIVVCSHLGRPNGDIVENLRMAPVATRLSKLLNSGVTTVTDCIGAEVEAAVTSLPPRGILLLENLRFHPGEESNDPEFSEGLSKLGQIFVNDAFGVAHRAHASTVGLMCHLPGVAGLLMATEVDNLDHTLSNPKRPFAAILGGAKVSDKLAALSNLAKIVDKLIVGGGMAATFLKAKGYDVGESQVEEEMVSSACDIINRSQHQGLNLLLPTDVIVAKDFDEHSIPLVTDVACIPKNTRIMDIGPKTIGSFTSVLVSAHTILWNGPMGVFEWPSFSQGTKAIALAIADMSNTISVLGGGSTAEVVMGLGLQDKMTHISTGGGASLEFMEGKNLPGIDALLNK